MRIQTSFDKLGLVCMPGTEKLGNKIDAELRQYDIERGGAGDSFIINVQCPRFSTGEAKGELLDSIRGVDLYILCDMFNHSLKYNMYGKENYMSPDDHFQDLKRVICATNGKASHLTVIMPMLYEGRQHRRFSRESLDCAMALKELKRLNVDDIITFDAHDPRVQNAIPLIGFESIQPTLQMLETFLQEVPDAKINDDELMIVSPDEGGITRCIYYSEVLNLSLSSFYKRRDYRKVEFGTNAVKDHMLMGGTVDLKGKNVIVVDDMIASGKSILDVAQTLKETCNAGNIYVFVSFGLFSAKNSLELFNEAYEKGYISRVFSTNSCYVRPEIADRPWYVSVDVSRYIALIIDTLYSNASLSEILNPWDKIKKLLAEHNA